MYLEITNKKTDMTNRSNNGKNNGFIIKRIYVSWCGFFLS